jgi:hypothetical protein
MMTYLRNREPMRGGPSRVAAALLAVALSSGCATSGPVKPVAVRLVSGESGGAPVGFTVALTGGGGPPVWAVRQDAGAPGESKAVVVQESADETSYRFPLCVYNGVEARDVAAEVRFKAIRGSVDQAAGLVLRYTPENYYIARANALEDNVDVFKVVNGKRLKIDEVDAKVRTGAWHTLRFEARGPHLTVWLDGLVVSRTEDSTFCGAGKVGLWTKADSVTAFADLHIEPAR